MLFDFAKSLSKIIQCKLALAQTPVQYYQEKDYIRRYKERVISQEPMLFEKDQE